MKKIIVAITGASGSIYAKLLVEGLLRDNNITEIGLIYSENGRAVADYEDQQILINDNRITLFDNSDMFSSSASGSAQWDSMVIVPCSMGTIGRVASGVSIDLISRSADVMLKERRQLICVTRETPLNTIHLRNMTMLSECGAVIMPASPSFYSKPEDMRELCMTVVDRILNMLGAANSGYEWGGAGKTIL